MVAARAVRSSAVLRAPPAALDAVPKARLRLTAYRGFVTATMCYDALPIADVFRKVDDDTLVGAMDLRGLQMPFMFVLRREPPTSSEARAPRPCDEAHR